MSRVVFLGTPEAAVPTLDLLNRTHEVGLVITQPDRPKGRSRAPVPPPVKEFAANEDLPIRQPTSRQELAAAIEDSDSDIGVVVAYGRILSPDALQAPEHGLLNVHFSLLPRWRGAAPVARALMAGDAMTGVTIIKLDEGLDTGPVLTAQAVDIPDHDDAGSLTQRLAVLGARLLIDCLPPYLSGDLQPVVQSEDGVTYADKLDVTDRRIATGDPASSVVSKVRALSPEPGATLAIDGGIHKVYRAATVDDVVEPGTWKEVAGRLLVGFNGGTVELVELQPPGRNRQSGRDWLNGRQTDHGTVG